MNKGIEDIKSQQLKEVNSLSETRSKEHELEKIKEQQLRDAIRISHIRNSALTKQAISVVFKKLTSKEKKQ